MPITSINKQELPDNNPINFSAQKIKIDDLNIPTYEKKVFFIDQFCATFEEKLAGYDEYKKLINKIIQNYKFYDTTDLPLPDKIKTINEGKEYDPLEKEYFELYSNVNSERLDKIVNAQRAKEDNLPELLPKTARASSLAELKHFLDVFAKPIYHEYLGHCSSEKQCAELTHLTFILLQKFNHDVYKASRFLDGQVEYHTYLVLKIKDDQGQDQEYRLDFTANQFSKKEVGLVITPRIKSLDKWSLVWEAYKIEDLEKEPVDFTVGADKMLVNILKTVDRSLMSPRK